MYSLLFHITDEFCMPHQKNGTKLKILGSTVYSFWNEEPSDSALHHYAKQQLYLFESRVWSLVLETIVKLMILYNLCTFNF